MAQKITEKSEDIHKYGFRNSIWILSGRIKPPDYRTELTLEKYVSGILCENKTNSPGKQKSLVDASHQLILYWTSNRNVPYQTTKHKSSSQKKIFDFYITNFIIGNDNESHM